EQGWDDQTNLLDGRAKLIGRGRKLASPASDKRHSQKSPLTDTPRALAKKRDEVVTASRFSFVCLFVALSTVSFPPCIADAHSTRWLATVSTRVRPNRAGHANRAVPRRHRL